MLLHVHMIEDDPFLVSRWMLLHVHMIDEEPVHKYDRFSHVIKELDEILEDCGYSREADAVSSVVASAHIASMKQTTLQDYLVPQPSAENP